MRGGNTTLQESARRRVSATHRECQLGRLRRPMRRVGICSVRSGSLCPC